LPKLITDFLSLVGPLDIRPSLQRSLTLHWFVDGVGKVNFGSIFPNGTIATNYICWTADEKFGQISIGTDYLSKIASLLPGSSIHREGKPWSWRVVANGVLPPVKPLLSHAQQWRDAIAETQQKFLRARPMSET
jgi:hypothetical protein